MKVELEPGEQVEVVFKDMDGEIVVKFDPLSIVVDAGIWIDSSGRQGEIYRENFQVFSKNPLDWKSIDDIPFATGPMRGGK